MVTTYITNGKPTSCEVFESSTATKSAVVVIAYGSDGMIDNAHGNWATMMREYASDLAGKGFTALIPDYFASTGTTAGSIDYNNGGSLIVAANRDTWTAALADAVSYAKTLPGVDSHRVGLLGFSLGGHLCLRVRSMAKVAVEFFAPLMDGIGDSGSPGMQIQIHHGTKDTLVSFDSNAIPIEQILKKQGAVTHLIPYSGASHGFVGSDAANTSASTTSRPAAISFFVANL